MWLYLIAPTCMYAYPHHVQLPGAVVAVQAGLCRAHLLQGDTARANEVRLMLHVC